jgi:DNA-binding response OmpR family regulator
MKRSPRSEPSSRPQTVVLINDDEGLRRLLVLGLQSGGFEVIAAATQLELQRSLGALRPDALVIDLQRSQAEGLELLERLRTRPSLQNVPIVFLAGSDAEDFKVRALSAGADWFGLRPYGLLELQTCIGSLIREGRAPPEARRPAQARRVVPLELTG